MAHTWTKRLLIFGGIYTDIPPVATPLILMRTRTWLLTQYQLYKTTQSAVQCTASKPAPALHVGPNAFRAQGQTQTDPQRRGNEYPSNENNSWKKLHEKKRSICKCLRQREHTAYTNLYK